MTDPTATVTPAPVQPVPAQKVTVTQSRHGYKIIEVGEPHWTPDVLAAVATLAVAWIKERRHAPLSTV